MIEVDILIIGSGISALKSFYEAKNLGKNVLSIDSQGYDGGYAQILNKIYKIIRTPLFIDSNDVNFFQNLGIDVECVEVEHKILKQGDYIAKTLGFSDIDVQENWFIKWLNNTKLCFNTKFFNDLKKTFSISSNKFHYVASIRKIDVEKKIAILSTGNIIKYNKLIYTWPLQLLPHYFYTNKIKEYVHNTINELKQKYTSLYINTIIAKKIEKDRDIDMNKKIVIYSHGTKASKMHTTLVIYLQSIKTIYTITSYTKQYPLIPGIGEKLFSELKRYKILTHNNILEKYYTNIVYGLINKIDTQIIKELEQLLENYNIILFGRLSQWTEKTVKNILIDKTIEQKLK